jgi:5-methylcytosine-specific restriction endonuclease McrA
MFEHGFACAYCGKTGVILTKDHVRPISRGGSDGIENIAPACSSCNSSKGRRTLAEWRPKKMLKFQRAPEAPSPFLKCIGTRADGT